MGMSSRAGSPEINVTPLIDVLLVLLIIFLVLMPMMMKTETVALPPNEEGVGPPEPPIVLELKADLTVSIDTNPAIPSSAIAGALRPQLHGSRVVFVDAEDGVPWHEVVSLVDRVRGLAGDPSHDGVPVAIRIRALAP